MKVNKIAGIGLVALLTASVALSVLARNNKFSAPPPPPPTECIYTGSELSGQIATNQVDACWSCVAPPGNPNSPNSGCTPIYVNGTFDHWNCQTVPSSTTAQITVCQGTQDNTKKCTPKSINADWVYHACPKKDFTGPAPNTGAPGTGGSGTGTN
ncbi:hypothetical protein [Mucilaginibacter gynuensis]|uniref:hypothetical protein n=1 Tax=Mucilaginibacter gynuensis TaxID=1302236 RepID=UPI0031E650A2